VRDFLFSKTVKTPSSLLVDVQRFNSQEMSRPGREVDHPPPSNIEVKNQWSYTFHPPIRLHGLDKNNLTLHCLTSLALLQGQRKLKFFLETAGAKMTALSKCSI
jgi:hypothetical protein